MTAREVNVSLEEAQAILAALVLMAGERKSNAASLWLSCANLCCKRGSSAKTSSQPGIDEPARI